MRKGAQSAAGKVKIVKAKRWKPRCWQRNRRALDNFDLAGGDRRLLEIRLDLVVGRGPCEECLETRLFGYALKLRTTKRISSGDLTDYDSTFSRTRGDEEERSADQSGPGAAFVVSPSHVTSLALDFGLASRRLRPADSGVTRTRAR